MHPTTLRYLVNHPVNDASHLILSQLETTLARLVLRTHPTEKLAPTVQAW